MTIVNNMQKRASTHEDTRCPKCRAKTCSRCLNPVDEAGSPFGMALVLFWSALVSVAGAAVFFFLTRWYS